MSITRLTGGITPGDGSDPRTFPAIFNDAADLIEDIEAGSIGGTAVYRFVETIYYTSNGTFEKADYPWLRAIRVKVQGAGGGGAGSKDTAVGEILPAAGGGGGAYAEAFITDIAGLDASVTVTRGAGGTGGVWVTVFTRAGQGGTSSFGTAVSANGGLGGIHQNPLPSTYVVPAEPGQTTATGDFLVGGGASGLAVGIVDAIVAGGNGGGAFLGAEREAPAVFGSAGANGNAGRVRGGGGSGAAQGTNQGTSRTGGNGAAGIVIVELYA